MAPVLWQKVLPLCVVAVQLVAQAHALPQNVAPSAAASVNNVDEVAPAPSSVADLDFNILVETGTGASILAETSSREMISGGIIITGNGTTPSPVPNPPATPALPVTTPPPQTAQPSITGGIIVPPSAPPPSSTPPTSVPALPEVTPPSSAVPPSSSPPPPPPASSTPPPPPPQSSAQSSGAAPPTPSPTPQPLPTPVPSSGAPAPSSVASAPPVSQAPAPSSVVVPGTSLSSIGPSSVVALPPVGTTIVGGSTNVVAPPPVVATSAGIVPSSNMSPPEATAEPTTDAPALPLTTQQVVVIPLPDTTVAVIDGTTLAEAPTSLINQITQTQTGAFTGYTGPLAIGAASSIQISRSMVWLAVAGGAFFLAA